jgi:cytidylate kinase
MSSLAEIKQAVDALPLEQRLELDAYIWASMNHLPIYESATVDDRMREMEAGDKIPWKSFREEVLKREQAEE